jgi:hypothetical protein
VPALRQPKSLADECQRLVWIERSAAVDIELIDISAVARGAEPAMHDDVAGLDDRYGL